jgi:pimeloyl-ACP methyl ester carboxylesterase
MKSYFRSLEGQKACEALYDEILGRWPVAHTCLRVPTRFGQTHVIESGHPGLPPLILLHGSASNALSWTSDVACWSNAFRVYAVDLPGEPGRSEQRRPSWDDDSFVGWLDDLLDGFGIPSAAFVGISLGAWAILRYATQRATRVSAAVLLAPSGITSARKVGLFTVILLSFLGRWGRGRINRLIWGGEMPPEAARYMDVIGASFRPRLGAPPLFTDAELGGLEMPLLLLAGTSDVLLDSRAAHARLRKLFASPSGRGGSSRADLRLLPGQPHALHGFAEEIRTFLEDSLHLPTSPRGRLPDPG